MSEKKPLTSTNKKPQLQNKEKKTIILKIATNKIMTQFKKKDMSQSLYIINCVARKIKSKNKIWNIKEKKQVYREEIKFSFYIL